MRNLHLQIKHVFYSRVVGTILFNHYCIQVEFVIFSLCNLAQNLIQQIPKEIGFSCRLCFKFECCYSKDVLHAEWYANMASVM